jgi:hypothetical protein
MIAFGSRVYGLGAFMLGVVGLVWGDFELVWQPVPASLPGRTALAYAAGAALAGAGASVNWHRTVAFGAAALAILYALGARPTLALGLGLPSSSRSWQAASSLTRPVRTLRPR